jgi:hypothetical protein
MSKLDEKWNRILNKVNLLIEKNKKFEEGEFILQNKIVTLENNLKLLEQEKQELSNNTNTQELTQKIINLENIIKQQKIENTKLNNIINELQEDKYKETEKITTNNTEIKKEIESYIISIDKILEKLNQ